MNYVMGWLPDARNVLPDGIGHWRWLLDPFLKKIAYGRVAGILDGESVDGAAIRISDPDDAYSADFIGGFVAYPFHDYPQDYYGDGAMLSFPLSQAKAVSWPTGMWITRLWQSRCANGAAKSWPSAMWRSTIPAMACPTISSSGQGAWSLARYMMCPSLALW